MDKAGQLFCMVKPCTLYIQYENTSTAIIKQLHVHVHASCTMYNLADYLAQSASKAVIKG